MMLFSVYNYLFVEEVKAAFVHLGFPDYLRIELAVAKFLGALVLLIPNLPGRLKLFAYFGFSINLISAFIAHAASGDPVPNIAMPLIFLVVLAISYFYHDKLKQP